MAVLDNLIETLNANNFFVPVSICVVVGAVLLFTVIKWLSRSDNRDKAASIDVDDDWDDKEIQGSSKTKTKQKKAKATNAQPDSGSKKITGKQSATAKVATPAAKEKQADAKPKASAKKQAASPVSSKSAQPASEVQGEWLVAGPKKKQKTKKTETNVQESKTKDHQADRQKNDVEVVKTKKSVADVAPKDIEQQHEVLVDSIEREVAKIGARKSAYDTVAGTSSQAEVVVSQPSRPSYDEPPAKNRIEEPLAVESAAEARVDEENVEPDAVGKEAKSKKSSKKKKSKVVLETTQVTDVVVQETTVTRSQQDDNSQVMANIPSSSVKKPETAHRVETVRKSDSERTKVGSKDKVAEKAKVVMVPDASKDVVKVAAKSVVKVASKDVVPDASKEVVPDSSKVVANDTSKGVANDASKDVVNDASKKTVPDASVDGPAPQLVVFDELGLQDSSADVGQPVLKKKKKARKDI